jgi:uncharacterized protein
MSIYYLDASAWLKRYFEEPGSERIAELFEASFDEGNTLAASTLAYVEAAALIGQQRAASRLDEQKIDRLERQLDADWRDLVQTEVTSDMVGRAVELTRQYHLRGADAVHLAGALALRQGLAGSGGDLVFVAVDNHLLEAARAAGLRIENPVSIAF